MDTTILVERDIKEGERFLRALDDAGVPVVGALWFHMPDAGSWRYMVASPLVDEQGPRKTYSRLESVREGASPPIAISLANISAVSPKDPLIRGLRILAGTPGRPFVGGIGLNKTSAGEVYVDDSYIFRMERLIGESGTTEMLFAVPNGERHKWQKREGKITTKNGLMVKVEIENHHLRQSVGHNGINAVFSVFQNMVQKGGKSIGDVDRWRVRDGRLRTVEKVATGVEIMD